MVVDHADRLHERIHDGRSAELEAAPRQLLGDLARQRGLGRDLLGAAEGICFRLAVEVTPQQAREALFLVHDLEIGARRAHGALDLQAVADDAGVLHQPFELRRRVAGDLLGLEAIEGAAEVLALAQDRDPGEAGLEAVQQQLLEQRAIVEFRHPPFGVMIGDVNRVLLRPGTTAQAVGVEHGRAHGAALAASGAAAEPPGTVSPGKAKRAHAGLTNRSSTAPAMSGVPAASASPTRSSRSSASPRLPAAEPIVPIGLPPAVTAMPSAGGASSKATGTTRVRAEPRCSIRETTSWPTKHPF